jgi:hypothetical protein
MDTIEYISREDAASINQKWYYTGIECQKGHSDKRYTNTGICYECKRQRNKVNRKNNPDTSKAIWDRTYSKNKKARIKNSLEWARKNKKKSNVIKNKWKQVHREKHLKQAREYSKNQRKDPFKRMSRNLSKAIWQSLNGKKGGKTWLSYVEFSIEDLIIHLESKFTGDMSWINYGKCWHIDHIKPLSWFNLKEEFKDAWSLNNLQPLKAFDNLSKGNKYIG